MRPALRRVLEFQTSTWIDFPCARSRRDFRPGPPQTLNSAGVTASVGESGLLQFGKFHPPFGELLWLVPGFVKSNESFESVVFVGGACRLALPESLVGAEQQRLGLGESGQMRLVAQRGIEDCYRDERATELASGFGRARASGPRSVLASVVR